MKGKYKSFLKIGLISLLAAFSLKACLVADIPESNITTEKNNENNSFEIASAKSVRPFKNIEINGVDYIQARGKIGKFGGTLYTSTIGEGPKTFNPWNAKDATSSTMGELMFDGLVATDPYTGEVVPQLAKSIKVLPSNKEYIITLRKGIKWSDGKPITAKDVVFTWNDIIIAGYGNTSMLDSIMVNGKPPKVEFIDDYTVRFITPEPFAPFLRILGQSIAPKHILEPVVKKGKKEFASFWGVSTPPKNFVTSGKFKLKWYIPAQRVEFVKNPDYYVVDKKDQKLPYLDNYIMYIVGDLNNQVLKFEAGDIDILGVRGSNVARFKELEKNSDYKMYNLGPNTGTAFATFNMNRKKDENGKYYVNPVKQKWFNDINFRKAVDYAIDRENMVSNVLHGVGAPLFTAESYSSMYLNHKLKKGHPKNIDKAKELLAKSGFKWNKSGKLLDKDNNKVEFNLYTNAGNTEREAVGVMLKQDLEELGMQVNFKPIEFNVLVGKLNNSLDWDTIIIALTGSSLEPHGGKNVWTSTGALHLFDQRKEKDLKNIADIREWEKELDYLFNLGAKTLDIDKRREIYDRYQEIVYNQAPMVYLYSSLRIFAIRKKFGNINPTKLGGMMHNLEEIYLKE